MSMQRPDVTDEDIGMRTFQLRKARAVERAIDRLRHALKTEWGALESREVEEVEWIFGELWAYAARDDWDHLHFGRLSMHDVRVILGFGRELRKHARNAVDILNDVATLVREKG